MAELSDEPHRAVVLESETPFVGKVWNVARDIFEYKGEQLVREYVDHPGAVAVLAIDDEDRVLLIRQYRHPIGAFDLELPAGLLDVHGEEPLAAAKRELAEEVDLQADDWSLLTQFYTSPGGSNEAIRVYLARGLSGTPKFDRTAEEAGLTLQWVGLGEAVDAVLGRRIGNVITCVALLAAQELSNRGWAGLGNADAPWPQHPAAGASSASAGAANPQATSANSTNAGE